MAESPVPQSVPPEHPSTASLLELGRSCKQTIDATKDILGHVDVLVGSLKGTHDGLGKALSDIDARIDTLAAGVETARAEATAAHAAAAATGTKVDTLSEVLHDWMEMRKSQIEEIEGNVGGLVAELSAIRKLVGGDTSTSGENGSGNGHAEDAS